MDSTRGMLCAGILFLCHCATPGSNVQFYDTNARSVKDITKRAQETPIRDTRGLKIYEHRLPLGFKFKSTHPVIELEYDYKRYEKLAHFKTDAQVAWYDYAGFSFYSFEWRESGRAYWCYPQVPLVWVTLALWNLVPLHYPCTPLAQLEITASEDNRRIQIPYIKRIATAMFATHVIIARWGPEKSSAEVFLFRETRPNF